MLTKRKSPEYSNPKIIKQLLEDSSEKKSRRTQLLLPSNSVKKHKKFSLPLTSITHLNSLSSGSLTTPSLETKTSQNSGAKVPSSLFKNNLFNLKQKEQESGYFEGNKNYGFAKSGRGSVSVSIVSESEINSRAESFVEEKDTRETKSRSENSLSELTKRFVHFIQESQSKCVDLNNAAAALNVQKRRIYDITNVLEGIGLIEKYTKNQIKWKGTVDLDDSEFEDSDFLETKTKLKELEEEELDIDKWISKLQDMRTEMGQDSMYSEYSFVTKEDVKALLNEPNHEDDTILAIRAPPSATIHLSHTNKNPQSPSTPKKLLSEKSGFDTEKTRESKHCDSASSDLKDFSCFSKISDFKLLDLEGKRKDCGLEEEKSTDEEIREHRNVEKWSECNNNEGKEEKVINLLHEIFHKNEKMPRKPTRIVSSSSQKSQQHGVMSDPSSDEDSDEEYSHLLQELTNQLDSVANDPNVSTNYQLLLNSNDEKEIFLYLINEHQKIQTKTHSPNGLLQLQEQQALKQDQEFDLNALSSLSNMFG